MARRVSPGITFADGEGGGGGGEGRRGERGGREIHTGSMYAL